MDISFTETKPEVIILSDAAFDKLQEVINDSEPNENLIKLMSKRTRWSSQPQPSLSQC